MKIISIFLILILISMSTLAFGQENNLNSKNELIVSDKDQIIIFTTSILIVIGIFIYISRNIILRKKTTYDKKNFSSQKNRDYEKYHSDWSDDYEGLGSKTSEVEEEFRKAVHTSTLPNYYKILGIKKNATQSEIKNRFRQLVKELHPDKTKDPYTAKKMTEINNAYEVLSDEELRKKYDKYLNVS